MRSLDVLGLPGLLGELDGLEMVAVGVFLVSLAGVVYLYFGYPLLLAVLSRVRPRPLRPDPRAGEKPPSVSVIIPAFNEEAVIAAKVANTRAQKYAGPLEVLVVSDGSTDCTEEIVEELVKVHDGLRLLALPRGGKARALNAAAAEALGDVLVLTDANALLAPGALTALLDPFADPEVGGACGRKGFRRGLFEESLEDGATVAPPDGATEAGEGLYWRWDQWQKEQESRIGSVFAADGALYAVRREAYTPIADPAQADDIAISARVVLQGWRLVQVPAARVFEEPPAEGADELRRKVRVTNHSVRALLLLGRGLWTHGWYSVELLSHKLLRHLAPFLLIPLFVSHALLAPVSPLYGATFAGHVAVYGLAVAGFCLRHSAVSRWRVLSTPYYFSMVNLAAFLGVLSLLKGERRERWTPRQGLEP